MTAPIGNGGRAVEITPEGGLAYWVINDTGAPSVKGTLIEPSTNVDNAVSSLSIDDVDPIGVIYDDGIADGELVRVVFTGRAHVLFIGPTTRHDFARNCIAADVGATNGQAISEALPTPPLATDKHFREVGHVFESVAGPGPVLALVNLHFN
jgi:hypothetical protein